MIDGSLPVINTCIGVWWGRDAVKYRCYSLAKPHLFSGYLIVVMFGEMFMCFCSHL